MPAVSKPTMGRNISRRLKQDEGDMIRELRIAQGMTQSELAEAVGLSNKQTICQIETGGMHIPVERVAEFSKAFGVDRKDFAKRVLRQQNPWLYAEIFGADKALADDIGTATPRTNVRRGPKNP